MTLEQAKKIAIPKARGAKLEKIIDYEDKFYFFFYPLNNSPFDSSIILIDKNTKDFAYLIFSMLPKKVIAEYRLNSSSENGR